LARQDRCWTAERLARRGLPHHPRCLLCDQLPETMRHHLIDCPFVKQVWHDALAWLRMTCRTPDSDSASLTDWITKTTPALPKPLRKGFATATLLIPWMLWKHRNDCVFNRARPSTQVCLTRSKRKLPFGLGLGHLAYGLCCRPAGICTRHPSFFSCNCVS
jgi:hypothetical protein